MVDLITQPINGALLRDVGFSLRPMHAFKSISDLSLPYVFDRDHQKTTLSGDNPPVSQKVLRHNLIVTLRKNEFALHKPKIVS